MVSDDFKCSYYRFLPGSTPEQATVTSTNTLLREPVKPFSALPIPLFRVGQLFACSYFPLDSVTSILDER